MSVSAIGGAATVGGFGGGGVSLLIAEGGFDGTSGSDTVRLTDAAGVSSDAFLAPALARARFARILHSCNSFFIVSNRGTMASKDLGRSSGLPVQHSCINSI